MIKIERLGAINKNKKNELMKVVEYNNAKNVIVEFQDEWKEKVKTNWYSFRTGSVRNPHEYNTRINSEKYNYQGCLMKVIEYHNCNNLIVEFQDGFKHRKKSSWTKFTDGKIKNPYHPEVMNVGMIGYKYETTICNGRHNKEYNSWNKMLQRCFDEKYKSIQKTYKDVTYCKEWLLYENFYEWLHSQENFEKWMNGDRWAVDKDILVKGNKVYSPETCCFVPRRINSLLINNKNVRGKYLLGVDYHEGKFRARCETLNGSKFLGNYNTEIEAFNSYKKFKEGYIKIIAEEYRDLIPQILYEALYRYEVDMED